MCAINPVYYLVVLNYEALGLTKEPWAELKAVQSLSQPQATDTKSARGILFLPFRFLQLLSLEENVRLHVF